MKPERNDHLYLEVRSILEEARRSAYRAVNFAMVVAYWEIGRRIVEHEQGGKAKAQYGAGVLKELSRKLTADFGKGFSVQNIENFRKFYLAFPAGEKEEGQALPEPSEKSHALRRKSNGATPQSGHGLRSELSWTHYRLLMRVEDTRAREYYLQEAIAQNWSTRALERQINSFYYERIVSSKKRKPVMAEAKEKTEALAASPEDFIKDPYVLEFLNLSSETGFLEKDLEKAIIQKLQHFLLELGKGFSFVAQQKRISAGEEHFYVDLVFYNYILKCFVLIDLKLGKLTHQDIGQMDLYVRWFEENMKTETDGPTIGMILCSEKNETIVKYSVLKGSKQLFASKYKLYLPTEEELKKEIEQELIHYKLEHNHEQPDKHH
jgi:predicted nuclease of restriction endonuclease-like (RecB) superfamily